MSVKCNKHWRSGNFSVFIGFLVYVLKKKRWVHFFSMLCTCIKYWKGIVDSHWSHDKTYFLVIRLLCICSLCLFHAVLQSTRIQGSVLIMRSPNSSISGNVCSWIRFIKVHPSSPYNINLPVVVSIKKIFEWVKTQVCKWLWAVSFSCTAQ